MRAKFVYESIKHLTPKSKEEIRDSVMAVPAIERLSVAAKYNIDFTDEEMKKYKEDLYQYVMQQPPHLRTKAAMRFDVQLTPKDLEKTREEEIINLKKTYTGKIKKDGAFLRTIRWWGRTDYELLENLLKIGADINAYEGRPIRLAIEKGNISLIKFLLKNGANPTLKNNLALKYVKAQLKNLRSLIGRRLNSTYDDELRWQQILKMIRDYERTHVKES